MLDVLGKEPEQTNRDILKGFYGTFKDADDHLRFVFLTGVTKFSQVSVFSGFNQPDDISMESRFDAICGITEEELYSYFAEPLKELAAKNEYNEYEMKTELKNQYDGYHFSSNLSTEIYNPFSIINAFKKMFIDDYWYKTGTPTYLAELLEGRNINMQKLTGQAYESRYFVDYRADAEDPLAMLYQSGYLTIKEYDRRRRVYKLDFPNSEVRKGFLSLIANSYFNKQSAENDNWIFKVDDMLRESNLDGVRDAFTSFQTDNDVFIFEFKLDGSAEEALKQIEEKQYDLPYLDDTRKLHKIGVNISSESRTVEEWLVAD